MLRKFTFLLIATLALSIANAQSTKLSNSFCSKTISNLGVNITCNVNLGQGHRFELSEVNGTVVGVYDAISAANLFPGRSKYLFRFNFLNECSIGFNTQYRIRVAWFNGNSWSSYGEYCTVNTPQEILSVGQAFQNTTVPSMGTNIRSTFNQMCGHRYEVRNLDNTLVGVYDAYQASIDFPGRSAYDFRFSWMPFGTIAEGRTYKIRIACYDGAAGVWHDYGTSVNVKTPGLPSTKLSSEWCGNVLLDSVNVTVTADAVVGATQYLFTITRNNSDTIASLIKNSNSFKFNELPVESQLEGVVFKVDVSTRRSVAFGFSDPGQSCNLGLRGTTTILEPVDCGLVYNYLIHDTLHALPVEGAQDYKFRIFDGVNYIEDTVSTLSNFTGISLINFPGIDYCTTYRMDVKVMVNGVWGPYGDACEIITVCNPTTVLRPMFCNSNVSSCGTNIYAQSILYAEGYQFYVVGGNINEIVTSTGNGGFKLQNLENIANLTYETTYTIKCRVMVDGVWGAWGEGCSVYLQTNSTLSSYCGQTIPSIGVNVITSSVGCASDYRFRINGPNVTDFIYNSPLLTNCFRFSQIDGVKFNSTYKVEVSVLVGGQWSPFGSECYVSTPTTLSIIENNEDSANSNETKDVFENNNLASVESNENQNIDDLVSVYPNPSTDEFHLNLDNDYSEIVIKVLDNSGRLIESINLNSIDSKSTVFGLNYPNGAYHLKIETPNSILTKKIIKLSK